MAEKLTYEELEQRVKDLEQEAVKRKQVEEALLESEERYRQIFSIAPAGIWEVDYRTGKIIDANDAVCEYSGYTKDELLSLNGVDLLTEESQKKFLIRISKVLNGENVPDNVDYEIIKKDGGIIWLSINTRYIYEGENVVGATVVGRDISERKQTEKALRESEENHKRIFENLQDVYYEAGMDGTILEVSPSIEKISQYKRKELIGKSLYDIYTDPKERDEFVNIILDKKKVNDYEIHLKDKDGSQHPCSINAILIRDNQGRPERLIGSMHDISERKLAEEALRAERNRIAGILEGTNAGTWDCNVQTGEVTFNQRWAEIMGRTLEEIEPTDINVWIDNVHPDDLPEANALLDKHFSGEANYYDVLFRQPHKRGGWVWVNARGKVVKWTEDGKPLRMSGTHLDITERKQAEEALRESEEKYRHLFESAMVGIYRTRIEDGKFLAANLALAKMLGYESVNRLVEEYITSKHYSVPELRKELLNQLQSHGRVDGFELEMIRADGSTVHIALSATAYPDQGYMEGVIVDITERKQAEAAQRESEQKFRALVEQSPHGISLIGKDGRYKYVNPRFQEIFGYTLQDCPTGKEWFKRAYPDEAYRQKVMEAWIKELQQAETAQPRPHVFEVTCKDGSRKQIHFRPVTMENRDQFVVYEDVTERSRMEHHLQQTQKFEAIGTLAGGIAHDFNNLLMGIQGRTSLMAADLEPFHSYLEHTNAIEDYIRSATDLTKQLLGLARGGKYEVKPTDTNELVRNSANMFGRTKKEIRIHTNFQDPPPVVAVDRSQIEQVLLNLYINAWQAMPGGGTLYLETQIVALDDAYCEPYQAKSGQYAKVSVTDTGIGMEASIRQRIFDPFFTTKEKGRGTGLGLASAYGIIKNHNGIITVYSEVGHGTTFNIYLPLSGKDAYREVPLGGKLIRGSETVLIVDDEEMILEVGQAMLEKLGYRVVVAVGGKQAIDAVKQKSSELDLVILDLIMPGMDGGKVFDTIRELRPQMPVMLSSGYAINGQADEIMKRGCNGFIQKPFNISKLSQKIRRILDEAKSLAQG